MKLIDLDKALAEAEDECRMSDDWKVSHEMMNVFKYQPTVKAIPIEWIEKKAQEFLMNRNFRWATDFQEVVDMWKVENNIPLFDNELKITLGEKENETN